MRRGLAPFLLLAACAAPPAAGEDPLILSGPMLGAVEPDRMRLWVELTRPATLQLELSREGGPWEAAESADGSWDLEVGRLRGQALFVGLQPATAYRYRLRAEGDLLPQQGEQAFRTPPPEGEWENLTIGFGSCAGDWGPDPTQPIFRTIAGFAPTLFLWLGDNVYFDRYAVEWEDPARMEERWRVQRAMPSLQELLADSSNLSIWDDHDYGPDNSDATYPLRFESLRLFTSYWANPGAGGPGEDGIWYSFRRGQVEFFMLDTRFDRSPDAAPTDDRKQMLSPAQWDWLERGLRASDAVFKVVVSGNQVLADYHRFETWGMYPRDRQRLYALIREEGIGGVVLLSGDRHLGEVLRRQEGLPYPLYEFTASPLAAGIGEATPDHRAPERLPGTQVRVEHFGLLSFRQGAEGPELAFRPHDVAGRPIGRPVLVRAAELQPQD